MSKDINYFQVGEMVQCGHCHPEFTAVEPCRCKCHSTPTTEKIKEEWEEYVKANHFFGETDSKIADWWLSKIDQVVREKKGEVADKIKSKFNGFGGALGFTRNELLALLTSEEEVK